MREQPSTQSPGDIKLEALGITTYGLSWYSYDLGGLQGKGSLHGDLVMLSR